MRRVLALLLVCGAGLVHAQDYAYRLEVATAGSQPAWRVALPVEVHRGVVRADFADMRVVNGAGEPVPFALVSGGAAASVTATAQPLPLFPVVRNPAAPAAGLDLQVRQRADGTLISLSTKAATTSGGGAPAYWIADASQFTEPLGELRLEWAPLDGVAAMLRVEGSDDLKAWRVLAERAPLLDLSIDGRSLRRDRVEIRPVRTRYLRLTVEGQGGPVPHISALAGVPAAKAAETPRRMLSVAGRAAAQPMEIEFDLGGYFHVDRVGFALPQVNTLTPAQILVRDQLSAPWRPLADTVLYRLAPKVPGAAELASPPISVGPTMARYWLLRLDARGGGVGQGEVRIEAGYAERHVVFIARGVPPFRIEYGQRANAGERDLRRSASLSPATLLPGYREGDEWQLPEARAGAVTTLNPEAVRRTLATDIDLRRLALWSVLLVAVLVLGVFAYKLMRGSARDQEPGA